MTDKIGPTLFGLYLFLALIDYSYWIALARSDMEKYASLVAFGWLPALFWPIHLISELWLRWVF